MKREMTLIQIILKHAECMAEGNWVQAPELPQYSDQQIHYHIGLCAQAGYIKVLSIGMMGESYHRYQIGHLSWEGHNKLELLRLG